MRYRFLAVTRSQLPLLFVAGASTLLSLAGCGDPGNSSPHFRLNNQGEDSDRYRVGGEADADARLLKETVYIPGRQYIADALEAMFGTPDQPYVFREPGLDLRKIRLASRPIILCVPITYSPSATRSKNRNTCLNWPPANG